MLKRKYRILLLLFMVTLLTLHSYHQITGKYDVCSFLFAACVLTFILDLYFVLRSYRLSVIYVQPLKLIAVSNPALYRKLCKAIDLLDRNRYKKSVSLLQDSLTLCKNDSERSVVHFFLGLTFSSLKQNISAQSEFLCVISLDPSFSFTYEQLGNSYFSDNNYDIAEQYYRTAITLDPNHKNMAEIYAAIAKCNFEKNCPETSIEYAKRAFELNKKDELSATLLAIIYGAEQDNDLATYYLNCAIKNGAKKKKILADITDYLELKEVLTHIPCIIHELAEASKKPSVHITYGGTGKSFVGGSLNETPPVDSDGKPMILISTLFCSEIPSEHLQNFPQNGVLRFYIADNDCYGLDFENNSFKSHKVLYSEGEESFQPVLSDHDTDMSPILYPTPISFQAVDDVVNNTDEQFYDYINPILSKYNMSDFNNLPTKVQDLFFNDHKETTKLFGYLFTTQDDPRPNQDSILLLQLISDDKHVMFGDCGVAHFFISPKALALQDFSKVHYSWDCS